MEIKLGICLPHTSDMVPIQFFDSFLYMDKPPEWTYHRMRFPMGTTSNIATVRNAIVRAALEDGCTHVLMMDTDQVYPPDTITKLLKHAESGMRIVTAKVHRRYPPFDPVMLRGSIDRYEVVPYEEWRKGGLVEVDATGAACMLVDIDVYLNMEVPWYGSPLSEKGKEVGEDIYFCYKARQAGYRIWVDTSINVGHLALMEIEKSFFEVNHMMGKVHALSRTKGAEGEEKR